MNIQPHIRVLRLQLLEMSRLSQRAVDYSIKAYELGSEEFCRHVRNTEHELGSLRRCIADGCRKLLVVGLSVDSGSRFAWSALRISKALHITYTAATEIAQDTILFLEDGRVPKSLALEEMGQLVNRLVRLYTVALFKEEVQHAKTVLVNQRFGRWFEPSVYQTRTDINQWIGVQATFELAITSRLGQIAKQAYEIADAITFWLEEKDYVGVTRERTAYALRESLPMRKDEEAEVAESSPFAGQGLFQKEISTMKDKKPPMQLEPRVECSTKKSCHQGTKRAGKCAPLHPRHNGEIFRLFTN